MRGPSSSHTAAANRIGRLCRDLAGGELRRAVVEYDPNGSLVTTHESQGSDMGLYAGFLGWECDDPRLPDYRRHIEASGPMIQVRHIPYGATHPNTYRLTIDDTSSQRHSMLALSTGGGMIDVIAIDNAAVRIAGDYFEMLVYLTSAADAESLRPSVAASANAQNIQFCACDSPFLRISTRQMPTATSLDALRADPRVRQVRVLRPVLPVLSQNVVEVPFHTAQTMLAWNQRRSLALWELAAEYECARGGITRDPVFAKTRDVLRVMESAVKTGLAGTEYPDRILPCQSVRFVERQASGRLIAGDVFNRIIAYVSAIMEVKSSMGVIVAAPTAGSCATLPGALLAVADILGKDEQERIHALLVAGLIGVFIATRATFSAEVGGCMAECGSASGMAAAALAALAGGNLHQQLAAASMALQNSFGMTCDPVANRVEAPCLGKNVMAAVNALACANMALADYKHLVPLDEVLQAMDQVGKSLPRELRCTGLGGLSVAPASRQIAQAFAAARS
ncbi:MAG: L-serine ammonia-lyase, iron-sulfur-dependent, subunit alpha [Planctomycetota bacterium]|nr:L-serine ammonia-lyase, iron-sulfur-dependent, subunit alpha [Planctomycetota bacterium]